MYLWDVDIQRCVFWMYLGHISFNDDVIVIRMSTSLDICLGMMTCLSLQDVDIPNYLSCDEDVFAFRMSISLDFILG